MIKIGICLILVAALGYGALQLWDTHRKYEILNQPIGFAAGSVTIAQITPQFSSDYDISIVTKRSLAFGRQNCLLGISVELAKCGATQSVLHVSWQLQRNGAAVARGGTDHIQQLGAWAVDTITRVVGTVKLSGGSSYRLEFRSDADGRALDITRPTLRVSVSSLVFKGDFALIQLGLICLIIVGAIGSAITLVGVGGWLLKQNWL